MALTGRFEKIQDLPALEIWNCGSSDIGEVLRFLSPPSILLTKLINFGITLSLVYVYNYILCNTCEF